MVNYYHSVIIIIIIIRRQYNYLLTPLCFFLTGNVAKLCLRKTNEKTFRLGFRW